MYYEDENLHKSAAAGLLNATIAFIVLMIVPAVSYWAFYKAYAIFQFLHR